VGIDRFGDREAIKRAAYRVKSVEIHPLRRAFADVQKETFSRAREKTKETKGAINHAQAWV
jgi:hypothetical protein